VSRPILDILNNHHLLLSTLLLSNALSLEALPIFLDKLVPSYLAVIISTVAVVVFG
jgi:metal transporter CNNM